MNKIILILSMGISFLIPNSLLMSDKPVFNCPELFDAVGQDLKISSATWSKVCYTSDSGDNDYGNSGDESGGGGVYNDDGSGDEDDDSGSAIAQKQWICNFICNNYREGCLKLGANIYSNKKRSDAVGHTRQKFLQSCIGWEEFSTTTKITSSSPSITTYFTTSTIPNTVTMPTIENNTKPGQNKYTTNEKLAGDIGILTTLGLMVLSALGICLYYTYKNPHP